MCVQTKAKQKASAFLRDDSDDEDSKKRIVKSHADKRYEELVEIVKALKNAMKVNDWNAIHDRDLPRHGGLARARALIRNTTPSRALQERERSFATQHPVAHCKSAQPACAFQNWTDDGRCCVALTGLMPTQERTPFVSAEFEKMNKQLGKITGPANVAAPPKTQRLYIKQLVAIENFMKVRRVCVGTVSTLASRRGPFWSVADAPYRRVGSTCF